MRTNVIRFVPAAAALAVTLVLTAPVQAGPPWISVEVPANPHHASTRGATFLVHAYHHSDPITPSMRAHAEGLVKGQRRTIPLAVTSTNRPGVFAVRADLPAEGTWLVAVTFTEGPNATATALVSLGPAGRVLAVDVPSDRTRDGWVVPRAVAPHDIDAALREAARSADADNAADRAGTGLAVLCLLGLAAFAGTRRR
jgi:hypothetical protein